MGNRICTIDGCDGSAEPPGCGYGYCGKHYQRWKRHGDPHYTRPRNVGITPCSIVGCAEVVKARTWCVKHWTRWQRYGDPTPRLRGEVRDDKRICPRCLVDTPLSEWGQRAYCRHCDCAISAAYKASNPDAAWRHSATRRARMNALPIEVFDRVEIFDRDGWICQICGRAVDKLKPWRKPDSPTLDHIVPVALGGAHTRANSQTACFACNMRKGARLAG